MITITDIINMIIFTIADMNNVVKKEDVTHRSWLKVEGPRGCAEESLTDKMLKMPSKMNVAP